MDTLICNLPWIYLVKFKELFSHICKFISLNALGKDKKASFFWQEGWQMLYLLEKMRGLL